MPDGTEKPKVGKHWYCRHCKFNLTTALPAAEVYDPRGHKMKRVSAPVVEEAQCQVA